MFLFVATVIISGCSSGERELPPPTKSIQSLSGDERTAPEQKMIKIKNYLKKAFPEGSTGKDAEDAKALDALSTTEKNDIFASSYSLAEDGFVDGFVLLSMCYKSGVGCTESPSMVVRLLQKCQEFGDEQSQDMLAQCYMDGYGVPEDIEKAKEILLSCIEKHGGILSLLRLKKIVSSDEYLVFLEKLSKQESKFSEPKMRIIRTELRILYNDRIDALLSIDNPTSTQQKELNDLQRKVKELDTK